MFAKIKKIGSDINGFVTEEQQKAQHQREQKLRARGYKTEKSEKITNPDELVVDDSTNEEAADVDTEEVKEDEIEPPKSSAELSPDLKVKLRKLAKFESKWPELLMSYRIANEKVKHIDSFEQMLREHTPCTTIQEQESFVEYLSNMQLRIDMTTNEFKKAAGEREDAKQRLSVLESDYDKEQQRHKSDAKSLNDRISTLEKRAKASTGEEIFSVDEDIPRRVFELEEQLRNTMEELEASRKREVSLQDEVEVKTKKEREYEQTKEQNCETIRQMKDARESHHKAFERIETDFEKTKSGYENSLEEKKADLGNANKRAETALGESKKLHEEMTALRERMEMERSTAQSTNERLLEIQKHEVELESGTKQLQEQNEHLSNLVQSQSTRDSPADASISSAAKKKKRKNKKSNRAEDPAEAVDKDFNDKTLAPDAQLLESEIEAHKSEIESLQRHLEEANAKVAKLTNDMEEMEELREILRSQGQDLIDAIETSKQLESEISNAIIFKEQKLQDGTALSEAYADLEKLSENSQADLDDLKQKYVTAQSDSKAAEKLAQGRYREITDLRDYISNYQRETNSMREDHEKAKSSLGEANLKLNDHKRLEKLDREQKAELAKLTKTLMDKEAEVISLKAAVNERESMFGDLRERTSAAERTLKVAQDARKNAVVEAQRARDELTRVATLYEASRARISSLEDVKHTLTSEKESLQEDMEMKSAQYASAQSLLETMREQTSELGMRSKEATEKFEAAEEELADAHKLLQERAREAETMRRLLGESEDSQSSRLRDLRERLDLVTEERDRAEEDAGRVVRRHAREIENSISQIRDLADKIQAVEASRASLSHSQSRLQAQLKDVEASSQRFEEDAVQTKGALEGLHKAQEETSRQLNEKDTELAKVRKHHTEAVKREDQLQRSQKVCVDGQL